MFIDTFIRCTTVLLCGSLTGPVSNVAGVLKAHARSSVILRSQSVGQDKTMDIAKGALILESWGIG